MNKIRNDEELKDKIRRLDELLNMPTTPINSFVEQEISCLMDEIGEYEDNTDILNRPFGDYERTDF